MKAKKEIVKKKASKEPETLNDYTKQKNEEGLKEIEEMLKHPVSLEQAKEQTQSFLRERNN